MQSRRLFVLSMLGLSFACGLARAEAPKTEGKPKSTIPAEKDPKRHEGFLKEKETLLAKGPIQLVFIGDSITDGWRGRGKAVWQKNYTQYNTLNLGIGGDRTEHILWRVEHGELDGLSPKAVVMMIGTNNSGSPVADIVAGIIADVNIIHEKLPKSHILLLAVFPRAPLANDPRRAKLKEVNEEISKLDGKENVTYLDIGAKFLEPDGTLPKTIMPDALHPNEKGYEIWAEAIAPTLQKLMK
jgi:lysophospholipase L1-like esterase